MVGKTIGGKNNFQAKPWFLAKMVWYGDTDSYINFFKNLIFAWIFIDFGRHVGVIFATFSRILAMCWEGLGLQSQPLPALSGSIRFHTFSHLLPPSRPDPCLSRFFLDFDLHFDSILASFRSPKPIQKGDKKQRRKKIYFMVASRALCARLVRAFRAGRRQRRAPLLKQT